MSASSLSATEQVFATPELLELIIASFLEDLIPLPDREDPRAAGVHTNTGTLKQLLRYSEVNRTWHECMQGSTQLHRALFLSPDWQTDRSWTPTLSDEPIQDPDQTTPRAPQLNPIIQTTFPSYMFRFWHLHPRETGDKHCAYIILNRRELPAVRRNAHSGRGKSLSRMLLSQPPCSALEATIWEERDETRDYVGRTRGLANPTVECKEGVTLGLIHEKVAELFERYGDVTAIKLTTV